MDVSTASRHGSVPEAGSQAALCVETRGPVRGSSPGEVGTAPGKSSDGTPARPVLARIPDVDADDLWDEQATDRPRDGRLLSQRLSLKLLAAGGLLLVAVAVAPFLWPGDSRDQGQGDGLPDWHPGPPAPSAEMAPAWKPDANRPAQADQQTPTPDPSEGLPLPAPPAAGEQFLPGTAPGASGFAGRQQPGPGTYGIPEPPEGSSNPRLHVLAPPAAPYGTPGGNAEGNALPGSAFQGNPPQQDADYPDPLPSLPADPRAPDYRGSVPSVPGDPHGYDTRGYDPQTYGDPQGAPHAYDPRTYDPRTYHSGTYHTRPADPHAYKAQPSDTRRYETQPSDTHYYNSQPSGARPYEQPSSGVPYSSGGQTGTPSAGAYPGVQTPLGSSTHACCPQHPAGSGTAAYPGQPDTSYPRQSDTSTGYPYSTARPGEAAPPLGSQGRYDPSSRAAERAHDAGPAAPQTPPRRPSTYDPSTYSPPQYTPSAYDAHSYNAGAYRAAGPATTTPTYGAGMADRRASVSPHRAGAAAQPAGAPAGHRAGYSAGHESRYGTEYPGGYPGTSQGGVSSPGAGGASLEGTIERPEMGTRY